MNGFLFLLLNLLIFSVSAYADEGVVRLSGRVLSVEGEAVLATLRVKNTSYGAATDLDGYYSLELKRGKHVLVVSAMGYKTVEMPVEVDGDRTEFDITLRLSVELLDEAVVVGKSESRTEREKGFALSAVDTKKAAVSNVQTSELLDRAAGVRLRQSGGAGSEIQYHLNGLSGNSIRIFIDGIPMENYGSSFSVSSLPPSLIDRIDIYKGVVPAHLADDALGGAIHIVLKQPAGKSVTTSYAYGSLNTHTWDLNAGLRLSSGLTFQTTAFFNHSDNDYEVWGDPITVTDNVTAKIEPIRARRFHDVYRSRGMTVHAGFIRVKWADRFLLGFIYSGMNQEIQHGATMTVVYGNRHSRQNTCMGRIRYEKRGLFRRFDLSVNATYASGERTVVDTVPYMYNWRGEIMLTPEGEPVKWNKGGGEAGQATLAANRENTFTARARMAYRMLPAHTLAANFLYDRFTRDIRDPYLSEAEQMLTDTRCLDKAVFSVSYDGKFWGDRLKANLFYKYYHQSVRLSDPVVIDGKYTAERLSRQVSDHGVGGAFSVQLLSDLVLAWSAEYAVRLPGMTELLGNTTSNVQASYGLRPERSLNLNWGAILGKFQWGKHGLEADFNLFYRNVKDMIQKSLTNLTDEMYGYENLGRILSKGVDVGLRYFFGHQVMTELALSYTDARFHLRYDGHGTEYIYYRDRLRNDPYFTADWSVEYVPVDRPERGGRLSFNYNLGYVHSFFRNWESLGGAGKEVIPSQLVHDAGVAYAFPRRHFTLSADVKNLLNEQVFDNWALQKPGRMCFVKLTYSFME